MSVKPNGGVAFPSAGADRNGMSLRDYFAAHASDYDVSRIIDDYWLAADASEGNQPSVAKARYIHADAMLAERAK